MYSIGFREAALKLYDYFKNMKTVSEALGVGIGSIWRWKTNGIIPKKRNDYPNSKFTDAMLAFIECIVDKNNELTLKDMQNKICETFNVKISRQCIALALRKLNITRKYMSKRGYCRSTKLVERHFIFIDKYKKLKEKGIPIIAMDESGYDQYVLPKKGYSKKGTKAICKTHPTRRKRISIIMSIDRNDHHYYEFVEGTTNAERFKAFIENQPWPKGTVLLMDNASIHTSPLVKKTIMKKGYDTIYIPPYTPECNPIENVFSVLKHKYRVDALDFSKQTENILINIAEHKIDKTMYNRCFLSMEKYIADYESKYLNIENYGIMRFCKVE